jgi:Flp pilus assembly protein TadB
MKGLVAELQDLYVLGIDEKEFVRRGLRAVLFAALFLLATYALYRTFIGKAPMLIVLLLAFLPLVAWINRVKAIHTKAIAQRSDMDIAVSVFLDLVNVLLAGGAGVETALLAAAEAGDGWSFEQIRIAIARAQSARRSYWDSLRELGEELGVDALVEVAHSVQIAGEHGGRVRQSLSARAQALRQRNLSRIEFEAEERTERMGLPMVVLFIGFVLLVGYPALTGTLGAL